MALSPGQFRLTIALGLLGLLGGCHLLGQPVSAAAPAHQPGISRRRLPRRSRAGEGRVAHRLTGWSSASMASPPVPTSASSPKPRRRRFAGDQLRGRRMAETGQPTTVASPSASLALGSLRRRRAHGDGADEASEALSLWAAAEVDPKDDAAVCRPPETATEWRALGADHPGGPRRGGARRLDRDDCRARSGGCQREGLAPRRLAEGLCQRRRAASSCRTSHRDSIDSRRHSARRG